MLNGLERTYLKLPVPLQEAIISFEGWRIDRMRFDGAFQQALKAYRARACLRNREICAFRDMRLHTFVRAAASSVPFYRRLFDKLHLDAGAINSLDALGCLPVLTKPAVQARVTDLRSASIPARACVKVHTSGTTGGGLRFAVTKAAYREQWAVWWRYRLWHQLRLGTWCGYFGGRTIVPSSQDRSPFWRVNRPGRQILFSAYHLSPGNLPSYIECLRRWQPPWLHGYPSLLGLLASHLLEQGEVLDYPVRWVTTGAENLLDHQREAMAEAFGVQPRQHYGMAEAVANFSECELGRLHVDEDFAAVEFIPIQGTEVCSVIGTNFTNPAFPLIRYDTGDTAEVSDEVCACGRPGRLVTQLDGRKEDYVILTNGARIGRLDHAFKDMTTVREAQILQSQPGAIEVRIVPREGYGACDEETLRQELHERLGNTTRIDVTYHRELQRSAGGKLRFVVSSIPGGHL